MRPYLKIVDDSKASKLVRFINFIIDRVVVYILFFCFGIILGFLSEIMDNDLASSCFDYLEQMSRTEDIIITTFVYLLYIAGIEYFTKGRSIGKYITQTKVVSIDGKTPTAKQIVIRNLSRIIPFEPVSFLWGTGWHDHLSDTQVVSIKTFEYKKQLQSEINEIGNSNH